MRCRSLLSRTFFSGYCTTPSHQWNSWRIWCTNVILKLHHAFYQVLLHEGQRVGPLGVDYHIVGAVIQWPYSVIHVHVYIYVPQHMSVKCNRMTQDVSGVGGLLARYPQKGISIAMMYSLMVNNLNRTLVISLASMQADLLVF